MKQNRDILKSYFETGDKPTQEQYEELIDSFVHKDDVIAQSQVDDLEKSLNDKANDIDFVNHTTDEYAHATVMATKLNTGGYPGTAADLKSGQDFLADTIANGLAGKQDKVDITEVRLTPSYLPANATKEIIVEANGITPNTTITFSGSITVNSSSYELNKFGAPILRVNITTTATEETADVTLNNGDNHVFTEAFQVLNGTVYVPQLSEWINKTGSVNEGIGQVLLHTDDVAGSVEWNRQINVTEDFEFEFEESFSPLATNGNFKNVDILVLEDVVTGDLYKINASYGTSNNFGFKIYKNSTNLLSVNSPDNTSTRKIRLSFDSDSNVMNVYLSDTLQYSFENTEFQNDVKAIFNVKNYYDLLNISYTDLSTVNDLPSYNDNYATKDEIKPAILSIADENGTEQFTVDVATEKLNLKGFDFDNTNKTLINVPLHKDVFFIRSGSSLSDAQPFNSEKPYPTLDAAVDAWKSMIIPEESDSNWKQLVKFKVLDKSGQTLTKPLVRPTVGNPNFKQPAHIIIESFGDIIIRNDNANTIFCPLSVNGIWNEVETRQYWRRLDIKTTGNLLLKGSGSIRTANYATNSIGNALAIHQIECNEINTERADQEITGLGEFFGTSALAPQGTSYIKCNIVKGNGGTLFRGAMSLCKIDIKSIVNDIVGGTMFLNFNSDVRLTFDRCTMSESFKLTNRGFKIKHGDIEGSYSGGLVSFIEMSNLDLEYKNNAKISVPVAFTRSFNSSIFCKITGNKVTYSSPNQTYVFQQGVLGSDNNIALDLNIRYLSIPNDLIRKDRGGSGVRLIKSHVKLGGVINSGLGSSIDQAAADDTNRLLECLGDCTITKEGADTNIVYNATPSSSGNFEVYIDSNLSIINGTINSNGNILKPSGTINTY